MTKNELIEYINKSDLWVVEGPAVFNTCYPFCIGFVDTRKYFNFGFDKVLLAYKGDYVYQFLDKNENINVTKGLVESFKSGKLKEKYTLWKKHRKTALDNFEYLDSLDFKRLSDEKLIKEYFDFIDIFAKQWTIPLILEGAAIYTERFTSPKFREENKNFDKKIVGEYFVMLTQPDDISFNNRERLGFLKICQKTAKDKKIPKKFRNLKKENPDLYRLLLSHQKNYHWIRNNYLYARPIKISAFFSLLKEELKNKSPKEINQEIGKIKNYKQTTKKNKRNILSKIKISGSLKKEIKAISFFGLWQDERKEMNLRGNYYIGRFLDEFCQRTKIEYLDMAQMLPKEIGKILKGGKEKWLPVFKKRRKKMITITIYRKGMDIFVDKDAEEIWSEIFKVEEKEENVVMVEGTVVSKGGQDYVRGVASIVLDPSKDKFKRGEILITSMTRPEFVPLMKKASAIITNEGGMTCHAAIVSRELGIPCIIGTKIATKVLKDGDEVEVDANQGIVKIIKRN